MFNKLRDAYDVAHFLNPRIFHPTNHLTILLLGLLFFFFALLIHLLLVDF